MFLGIFFVCVFCFNLFFFLFFCIFILSSLSQLWWGLFAFVSLLISGLKEAFMCRPTFPTKCLPDVAFTCVPSLSNGLCERSTLQRPQCSQRKSRPYSSPRAGRKQHLHSPQIFSLEKYAYFL